MIAENAETMRQWCFFQIYILNEIEPFIRK